MKADILISLTKNLGSNSSLMNFCKKSTLAWDDPYNEATNDDWKDGRSLCLEDNYMVSCSLQTRENF